MADPFGVIMWQVNPADAPMETSEAPLEGAPRVDRAALAAGGGPVLHVETLAALRSSLC